MNGWIKKAMAALLTGTIALSGAPATAWATSIGRDNVSNFTNSGDTANGEISSFNLIKDYDSENATKLDTYNTQGAPLSSSPVETFTYIITPYGVWNAGMTSITGTTAISTDNMPMFAVADQPSQVASGVTYSNNGRTFTVTQEVAADSALKENTESNAHDTATTINLPTYDTVGDYWYMVQETIGNTTGVFYGTNDAATSPDTTSSNGTHTAIYYIHVQVTEKSEGTQGGRTDLVRNVTLHKTAPDSAPNTPYSDNTAYNDGTSGEVKKYRLAVGESGTDKVNAIENRYYAGQLQVTKHVTGNAGDKNKFFKVKVTFTKPEGTVVNSDIAIENAYTLSGSTYSNNSSLTIPGQYHNGNMIPAENSELLWDKAAGSTIEANAVAVFYVKDGTTVTFSNIPYGINYTVEEYTTGVSGYRNEFGITGDSTDAAKYFDGQGLTQDAVAEGADTMGSHFYTDNTPSVGARGSITDSSTDVVTITNNKEMPIDIGVVTKNAPYIAMIVVAGIAVALMVARKKTAIED